MEINWQIAADIAPISANLLHDILSILGDNNREVKAIQANSIVARKPL